MDKAKKMMVTIVLILFVFLIFSLILGIEKTKNNLNASKMENYTLGQENEYLKIENEKLFSALKREHLDALKNNPKLLVANLAWIDCECGTHYIPVIIDDYDEDVDFEKIKDALVQDEKLRKRALGVIANYLEYRDIFSVTEEYYDYLVSDDYQEYKHPEPPREAEIDDKTIDPENPS